MVRLYDVETKTDQPQLPLWAIEQQGFPLEVLPNPGDELKISEWSLATGEGITRAIPERGETHYWRVIRCTHDLHPRVQLAILGVRYVPND